VARPIKPRVVDGIPLADNLYQAPNGRPGYYRYRRQDGTFKHFKALNVTAANKIAEEANALRDFIPPQKKEPSKVRGTFLYHLDDYIAQRLKEDPALKNKPSWKNRTYALKAFCKAHPLLIKKYTRRDISAWWSTLTHDQHVLRHAEFRKFFNYLMGADLLVMDYNPFTTADDRPRLYIAGKPKKKRQKLELDDFWKIYDSAGKLGYPCLQVAMGISLTTFLREDDILKLRWSSDIEEGLLKKVVGKSLNQRDEIGASRLQWNTNQYELLRQLLKRARELRIKNTTCPFVIAHRPKSCRPSKVKEHHYQVLPSRLQEMFVESRTLANITVKPQNTPPTFHEIRNLVSAMAANAGYPIEDIKFAMAHTDERTTRAYQASHDLPYTLINIQLTSDLLGGRDFT